MLKYSRLFRAEGPVAIYRESMRVCAEVYESEQKFFPKVGAGKSQLFGITVIYCLGVFSMRETSL